MIKLNTISVSNFLSFGKKPTVVELSNIGHTIIKGNNLDVGDAGESTNGVGKTSQFQAIIFALYGKGIDKLKPDEFINIKNKKKMVVELDFEVDGESYTIRRGRKPSFVEFNKGNVSLTRDAMKNTDEDIQKLIDIPYEVFMTVFFMSPQRGSFMGMTSAEQRNYMESVLSLDVLAERAESLKAMKKDSDMNKKLLERDLNAAESSLEAAERRIERLESQYTGFEDKRSEKLTELSELINDAEEFDFDAAIARVESIPSSEQFAQLLTDASSYETEAKLLSSTLKEKEKAMERTRELQKKRDSYEDTIKDEIRQYDKKLERFLTQIEYEKQIEVNEQVKELQSKRKEVKTSIDHQEQMMNLLINSMESDLSNLETLRDGKCPYCEQSHYDESKVSELSSSLDNNESKLATYEDEIAQLNSQIDEIDGQLNDLEVNPNAKNDLEELIRLTNERGALYQKLGGDNPYQSELGGIHAEHGSLKDINSACAEIEDKMNHKQHQASKLREEHTAHMEEIKASMKAVEDDIGTVDVGELKGFKKDLEQAWKDLEETRVEVNPYEEELKDARNSIPDVDSIKNDIAVEDENITHIGYLVKLLTDPKSFIRKNIIDQYIPFVNKKINEYSEKLGLSHVSSINPDMTVDISYMQNSVSFFNMSQGERMRLNLATSMAFRDLLGVLGKSTNLLMVDEVFDANLDTSGIRQAFKFIKGKTDNLLLVSHREDLASSVDKTLTVTKQNGFSFIS